MSESIAHRDPNDQGSKGDKPDGVDPAVAAFNAEHKKDLRAIFRGMIFGTAHGTAKRIAEDQDLGGRVQRFIERLNDLM